MVAKYGGAVPWSTELERDRVDVFGALQWWMSLTPEQRAELRMRQDRQHFINIIKGWRQRV